MGVPLPYNGVTYANYVNWERCFSASTTTDVGINHSKLTEDVLVLLLELMWVCVCVCVCV